MLSHQMISHQRFVHRCLSTHKRTWRKPLDHRRKNKFREFEEDVAIVNGEVLYGYFPVLMALKAGRRKFHALYYNEDGKEKIHQLAELARDQGIPTKTATFASLDDLAQRHEKNRSVHQGVCADVDRLPLPDADRERVDHDAESPIPLWLLLCGIKDPMNLGSILRSAYFLGVDRVVTTPQYPSSSPTPVVSKASAGVLEIFPPHKTPDATEFLSGRLEIGWQIVGSGGADSNNSHEGDCIKLDRPTILLLGNEGSGIPEDVAQLCTGFLRLDPGRRLHAHVDSLNVSVASALLIQKLRNTPLK